MIPLRTIHNDPKVYGDKSKDFVADRFLSEFQNSDGTAKKRPTMSMLKLFGGGTTLCPGRHFAANESVAFIASALRKFDIQLVEGQKEAKPLTSAPTAGIYPPDRDIFVRIKPRK